MPNIYTHNKFGKLVAKNLNPSIKKIIDNNEKYYRIGQQGPDIFYFNIHHWSKEDSPADIIHGRPGAKFLEKNFDIMKYKSKEQSYVAYMVGSICHFILDSKVHPLVNSFITEDYGHIDIEVELDRKFLLEDGADPKKFKLENILPKGESIYRVLTDFYNKYAHGKYKDVKDSIFYYRLFKRILRVQNQYKEKFLLRSIELLGKSSYKEQVMGLTPKAGSKKTNGILEEKFYETVKIAPELIENAFDFFYKGAKLAEDFNYNYEGCIGGKNEE